MSNDINLTQNLNKLNAIAQWFDEQSQVDVEEGLEKVKEAAILIKESKSRLKEIENEFAEIQAAIAKDDDIVTLGNDGLTTQAIISDSVEETDSTSDKLPF